MQGSSLYLQLVKEVTLVKQYAETITLSSVGIQDTDEAEFSSDILFSASNIHENSQTVLDILHFRWTYDHNNIAMSVNNEFSSYEPAKRLEAHLQEFFEFSEEFEQEGKSERPEHHDDIKNLNTELQKLKDLFTQSWKEIKDEWDKMCKFREKNGIKTAIAPGELNDVIARIL